MEFTERRSYSRNFEFRCGVAAVDDNVKVTSGGEREKITTNGLHWIGLGRATEGFYVTAVNEAVDSEFQLIFTSVNARRQTTKVIPKRL